MKKILTGILLGLVAILTISSPALAIENPDSISIEYKAVFEDVLETGDVLVFARYQVNYASQPAEDSEDTFMMAIYDTDGTTLIPPTRGLNYYQHNIISIYWDAASNPLTTEGTYLVRIMGNPAIFTLVEDTTMDSQYLAASDWKDNDLFSGIMVTQAEVLEADWEVTLLTATDKLNATGSYYFTKAIPGLQTMLPTLFEVGVQQFTFEGQNTVAEGYAQVINNTPTSLESATDGLNAIFGIENENLGEAGWAVIAALVVGGVFYAATRRPDIAIMGGVGGTCSIAAYVGMAEGDMLRFVLAVGTFLLVLLVVVFVVPRYG